MTRLDPTRVSEIFARASSVRVLVVGDLMLDRYVSGRAERISPEAPVPVVLVDDERLSLGGAGNVAANVTALGADCSVVGCVGADPEAQALVEALEAGAVEATGVVRSAGRPTTLKTRVRAGRQQIVRFDREDGAEVGDDVALALCEAVSRLAPLADAVVVQDYDKGVMRRDVISVTLAAARDRALPIVVDPKRRRFFEYGGATVLKPNERELEEALGGPARPDDGSWMERTRERLECSNLLVTLGDRGMALQSEDGRLVRLPAEAEALGDVSGAGDTVTATVAVALAAGASVVEAATLANHAAAVEVTKAGVQTVTPEEIRAHMDTHDQEAP